MVLYPILLIQSWSTTVPNFMLVSGIAQSGQNLALSRLAICNKFNKFNNTGAGMLDSIYHMTLKLLKNYIYGMKMSRFCHLLHNVIMDIMLHTNL